MGRSYSSIGFQLAPETIKGTAVPANKRLMGLTLEPTATIETKQHRPSGSKVATVSQLITESTEADYDGPIDYNTIVYPLSSLFGATTPEADATESTAYTWSWSFTGRGETQPQTFTVETGDAAGAKRFSYGTFSSMEMSIDRVGDNTISGSMIGQALELNKTLTPSPSDVDILPVNGDHWDVFADPSSEDLGTTQLLAVYEAGLNFDDFFEQEFTINSAYRSFTSVYDAEEPSFEWSMMLGADAVGEAYLTDVRNSAKKFIRLQATGPTIAGTVKHSIVIDMCVAVTEFDSFQSKDGLYVLPITYTLLYDKAWGRAMEISVTNSLSAL